MNQLLRSWDRPMHSNVLPSSIFTSTYLINKRESIFKWFSLCISISSRMLLTGSTIVNDTNNIVQFILEICSPVFDLPFLSYLLRASVPFLQKTFFSLRVSSSGLLWGPCHSVGMLKIVYGVLK